MSYRSVCCMDNSCPSKAIGRNKKQWKEKPNNGQKCVNVSTKNINKRTEITVPRTKNTHTYETSMWRSM